MTVAVATAAPTLPVFRHEEQSVGWPALTPVLLFAAAMALRSLHFGDPAYDLDEQFYLLVGDRLLHGALPFVDVWDRKPIGLFLLYAAIRLLGGEGIWQYQIVATLFAAATAWTIARIARPAAGHLGGLAAGLAYLVWIETVEGGGGQAPVFYNLLVALAAERVLAAGASGIDDDARFRRQGRLAMLLAGLAIQLKYTVVCEAVYFGLMLVWWGVARLGARRAIGHSVALAAIALAPTIMALAVYSALGEGHAFVYANFLSIFARAPGDAHQAYTRLGQIALQFVPFAVCWAASLWEQCDDADLPARRRRCFIAGWMIAAIVGFGSVGAFYVHYALPLFMPAAVGAAPIFRRRPLGLVMAGVLLWLPLSHMTREDLLARAEHRAAVTKLFALLPADLERRCLQLFDGPPILYLKTHACLASRFAFPDHLIAAKENRSLGIDRAGEIEHLFARPPGAIIVGARSFEPDVALDRQIRRHLKSDYRRAGSAILDGRAIEVFVAR